MGGLHRSRAAIAALSVLLVLAGVPVGQADSSTEPFVVDAGDSEKALDPSQALPVSGEVHGGKAPFAYLWTIDESGEAFADPTSASTSVDLSDYRGPVTLNLTVLDARGETASDTVQYHVAQREGTLLERTVNVTAGAPVGFDTIDVPFDVPAGTDAISAVLSWQDDSASLGIAHSDLDMQLVAPDGFERNPGEGRTGDHPERIHVDDPPTGEWTAEIEPYASGPENATLTVYALDSPTLPRPLKSGPKLFGVEETQKLVAEIPRNPAHAAQWDLDGDGIFEVAGDTAIANEPVGEHTAVFEVVDANGYEVENTFPFEVTDRAEETIAVLCNDRPGWDVQAMEFTASGGTCYMHSGHQTYDLGHERRIVGGEGRVLSVEQQFSPPTELESATTTPIHIETSQDAQTWTELHDVEYAFAADLSDNVIGDDLAQTRQHIEFSFDVEDRDLRYLRFHEPRSAAQGLSGFLDESLVYLYVNETIDDPSQDPVSTQAGSLELSCEDGDVLEDFFAEHPCTFGGVNRYDAPSLFHTYHPGAGTQIDRVEVTTEVGPYRTDDYFMPLNLTPDEEAIEENEAKLTNTSVRVQTSTDGAHWTTIAREELEYLEETTFEATLDEPVDAPYLRLLPAEHRSYDDHKFAAPLHHPEAFFLHSSVTLHGQIPRAAS